MIDYFKQVNVPFNYTDSEHDVCGYMSLLIWFRT